MATDPVRTANGIMVFIPANGTNIIQPGQGIPGTVIQPPGMAPYVGQQFGSSINQPKRRRCVTALEKLVKVEMKTLGAIQILIGLIHIGLGGVSITLSLQNIALGYAFWGGLFFIASGSVSVSADKHFNSKLVKCSLGMNITSAILSTMSIILCLIQLGLNSRLYLPPNNPYSYNQSYNMAPASIGIGVLFLLFSFLEFSITVSVVHFGCQGTCCTPDTGMVVLPCTVAEDGVTLIEGNPAADSSPNSAV